MFGGKKAAAPAPPQTAPPPTPSPGVEQFAPDDPLEESGGIDDEWTTASWLKSLGLHRTIAKALESKGSDQFDFVSKRISDEELRKRLTAAGLVGLVEPIAAGLQALRKQKAATGAALSSKFAADGDAYKGEMGFASIDVFFRGLEGLVGPPLMVEGTAERLEPLATKQPSLAA